MIRLPRFGKFGELNLREKLRKEWLRNQSVVSLPEGPPRDRSAAPDYLSVAAIMKNEARYLAEWIEFHRLVGVERFYLYDNDSTDDSLARLKPWRDADIVRVIPWPRFIAGANPQYLAYAHAAALTAGATRWLACIDLDEFLFPVEADDLRRLLGHLEMAESLAVFRREFAFGGHDAPPEGLVIGNYTLTRPLMSSDRAKYKSITDPARARAVRSAHGFVLDEGAVVRNEGLEPLQKDTERRFDIRMDHLRVNHYFTKSRDEFRWKLSRGNMTDRPDWKEKISRAVEKLDREATETDTTIQRFLPQLETRLRHVRAGSIPDTGPKAPISPPQPHAQKR